MANPNYDVTLEGIIPMINTAGAVNTNKPVNITGTLTTYGAKVTVLPVSAVNSTATLTAAQVVGGYITTTSAAAVTMTMPTGTALGAYLGATQGTTLTVTIDNTAGANGVTMAVNTNAVQSDWDNQITAATASVTPATVTPLTITSGTSGIGIYRITFSSSTAYVFSRES